MTAPVAESSEPKLSGFRLAWRLAATWIVGAFVLGVLGRIAVEAFRLGWTLLGGVP
jgi:hypothetical protein